MSEPDDFDVLLKQRFDQEHAHTPGDAFIADTLRRIRTQRRRTLVLHTGLRAGALAVVVLASPWLIAGAVQLNAALQSPVGGSAGFPALWVLGGIAVSVLLVSRVRRR